MIPHLDIPVSEASQVGEARRAGLRLATEHGLDETARGRVALIVTELGTNLTRHAKGGRLLIGSRAVTHGGAPEILLEIISIDTGPGMADVQRCLRDGYSTGSTPGTGLGAVQRLASDFSVFSGVGKGTVILARLRVAASSLAPDPAARAHFACAGICLAAPGEVVSGDAWDVRFDDCKAYVIVADGLGHGPVAAEAARVALDAFGSARGSPAAVLERTHPLMRSTRGAAVAVAELDTRANTVVFAGAGNISGRMISGIEDRSLMSQHGTLGVQIRRLQDVVYPWSDHAMVVMHSDGLTTRWNINEARGLLQCDPAVVAGWLLRDHTRGHDDVTVVVLKRG